MKLTAFNKARLTRSPHALRAGEPALGAPVVRHGHKAVRPRTPAAVARAHAVHQPRGHRPARSLPVIRRADMRARRLGHHFPRCVSAHLLLYGFDYCTLLL